ncbi:hypothetical protein MN116_000840, partial [Schistosoma mekongi]
MRCSNDRREKLVEQILEWNSNRLDLFELSIPDEKCEFNGVMRFFLQDDNRRFQTKCIRVSSSAKTSEVADILKEKFCAQEPSLVNKCFGIYEQHANGVRRLTNDEYPLLVQLSWSKLDREGKFVLKLEPNSGRGVQANISGSQNQTKLLNDGGSGSVVNSKTRMFRRGWSFRREKINSSVPEKTTERRRPLGCATGVGLSKTSRSNFITANSLNCLPGSAKHHANGDNIPYSHKNSSSFLLNPDALPDSLFTRTIYDPETIMQRKRQRTLQAKLIQMLHHDSPESGGALKIYGGQLFPEIPYKTLLISITDNVAYILRESLNKYGLDDADPDAYCLVMRKRNSHDISTGLIGHEEILSDDTCPLEYLLASSSTSKSSDTVITFELRSRPPHLIKKKPFISLPVSSSLHLTESPNFTSSSINSMNKHLNKDEIGHTNVIQTICLIELDAGDESIELPHLTDIPQDKIYPIPVHKGEVYVGTATGPDKLHPNIVCLPKLKWSDVELYHIMFWSPAVSLTTANNNNMKSSKGWLACRPCLLSSSCTSLSSEVHHKSSVHKITEVYLNNSLLTIPTNSNYHELTFWLKPGDLLRLGKECHHQLKVWTYVDYSQTCTPTPNAYNNNLVHSSRITNSHSAVIQSHNTGVTRRPSIDATTADCNILLTPQHNKTVSPYLNIPPYINECSPERRVTLQNSYLTNIGKHPECEMKLLIEKESQNGFLSKLCPMANPSSLCDSSSSLSCTSTSETISSDSTNSSLKAINTVGLGVQHQQQHNQIDIIHLNSNTNSTIPVTDATENIAATTTGVHNNKPQPIDCCSTVLDRAGQHTFSRSNNPCLSPQLLHYDNNSNNRLLSISEKPTATVPLNSELHHVNTISSEQSISPNHSYCSTITKGDPIDNSKGSSTRTKTSVSDRLPCQMAFAPITLEQLLDWIITKQLKFAHQPRNIHTTATTTTTTTYNNSNNSGQSDVTIELCPLGPSMCIYLMLRAICRQCDRWEAIEWKQLTKSSNPKVMNNMTTEEDSLKNNLNTSISFQSENLPIHPNNSVTNHDELILNQLQRRQRHLLSLFISAVDRFHSFELYVNDRIKDIDLDYSMTKLESNCPTTSATSLKDARNVDLQFITLIKSVTAWLANSSQLLHLTTRDIDFNTTFKSSVVGESRESNPVTLDNNHVNSWNQLKEQLAEIVQTAFVYLADLCVFRLDLIAIPELLQYLTKCVQILSNPHNDNRQVSDKSADIFDSVDQRQSNSAQNSVELDEINDKTQVSSSNHHYSVQQRMYNEMFDSKHNITLKILDEILNCLHLSYVNPAFTVQLFAHLLHRLNARLFNFIIGYDCDTNEIMKPTHISPLWGKCLHDWIHFCIEDWANTQGLSLAAECYLQRISQAADLMLCDMKSVESLYNLAVDLISLNSRQVQVILENYQLMNNNNNDTIESRTTTTENFNLQQQIPKAWIEFVVSGVKLVADRILTEDNPCHSMVNQEVEEKNATKPSSPKYLELGEPLDLHLPFLLPEDCYPSDNPVPINNSCYNSSGSESNVKNKNDSIISQDEIDSGICSQSNSINQKHHHLVLSPPNGQVNCNNNNNTTIITVDSIKHFLTPAIQIGWCRLSIRSNNNNNVYQLDKSSMVDKKLHINQNSQQFLRWNVYLSIDSKSSINCHSVEEDNNINNNDDNNSNNDINIGRLNKHSRVSDEFSDNGVVQCKNETIGTATSYSSNYQPNNNNNEVIINQLSSISLSKNHSLRPTNQLCSRHCTYSVVVPKIGPSLGLSIVAARSEYGDDLGIYVRGINSESGASQAKLIYDEDYRMNSLYSNFLLTPPYLRIGDRLISVNGQSITGLSQDDAVRLVSSTTYEVILTVVRYAKQDVEQKDKITTTAAITDPSKSEESDLQCIDCLLHESLLSNYKDLVKDNGGEDEQSSNICVIQDSARKSVNQSGNNDNNNSSGTQLKHPPLTPTTTLHINNSSNNGSSFIPNVHIGMKLSIDTNCSHDTSNNNKCRTIHSDYFNRKWNYQSNTICRNNNSINNNKISDGFTNLPGGCNLPHRNRSASTNERQLRLYIDASSCNSNSNIYDEPSISEYSLCNESFLSTSKLEKSGMRTLSPHNTTNNSSYNEFEQNTLPTRPCHRPKGQSVSFDDRLTASRFTQLHEGMKSSIPNDTKSFHHNESMPSRLLINSSSAFSPSTIASIQSPNQSFMNTIDSSTSTELTHTASYLSSVHKSGLNSLENNRPIHSTLGQNTSDCTSSSVSSYHPSSKHSSHYQHHHNVSTTSCSSPNTTSNKISQISTVPTLISGSKPPKTFVPTAYVLP